MDKILYYVKLGCAFLCMAVNYLFGGADALLITLITLIVIDYVTGVMAAIYHKEVSSEIGYKGIVRKVGILIIVAVAHLIGHALSIGEIRSLVIGFYIANEGISILENCGRMGLPIPDKLLIVLKQIKSKAEETPEDDDKEIENENNEDKPNNN